MRFFRNPSLLAGLGLAVVGLGAAEATCKHPPYSVHILSHSPLVIYIPGFLTKSERDHLLESTANSFSRSQTADESGDETQRSTRTSRSATPPRDAVTRCVEERALLFQGFDTKAEQLEPLQLVQYGLNETFHMHTDWFTSATQATADHGGNRLTSFFAYVKASDDISGGGTTFPMVDAPKDERWCNWIDCDAPWDQGTTFRPVPGNAVFWVNMVGGRGDQRTIHAGDVVTAGSKVGMNIWTREGLLNKRYRGEEDAEEEEDL